MHFSGSRREKARRYLRQVRGLLEGVRLKYNKPQNSASLVPVRVIKGQSFSLEKPNRKGLFRKSNQNLRRISQNVEGILLPQQIQGF